MNKKQNLTRKIKTVFLASCIIANLLFLGTLSSFALNEDEYIQAKKEEIQVIQQQIEKYQKEIESKRQEKKTLQREIFILDQEIKKTDLEITQIELMLEETEMEIKKKEEEIKEMENKMAHQKLMLAEYLRQLYQSEQVSILEVILEKEKFSDFFEEIRALENIHEIIKESLNDIQILKVKLEEDRQDLDLKKEEQEGLRALAEHQRISLGLNRIEKEKILAEAKGQEERFQELIRKAQEDIAAIRNQMYLLKGVGSAMTLEEAFERAGYASSLTGVRPAFLLAVLKKESSWGTNVGKGHWREDMNPGQHEAFLQITKELGLNPDEMPVSRKPTTYPGWGGAMGPAQFMPRTWLGYKDEIARLTGHTPPSPWNLDDAFVGAGLKLGRAGAEKKDYNSEWKAAMMYFAGNNYTNSIFRFYGDSVMELAGIIQEQLDIIKK